VFTVKAEEHKDPHVLQENIVNWIDGTVKQMNPCQLQLKVTVLAVNNQAVAFS